MLETFLLALALCVDSLTVSTACALKTKISYRRGLLLAVTFGVFQGGFPLLGALLGTAFERFVASVDHWIAFALLAMVGGKMIWDAFHNDDDAKPLDLSRYWVICSLAVATSIDAFVVGIGLGLERTMSQCLFIAIVVGVVTFVVSMFGVFLGRRNVPIPDRWSTFIAGVVLIGLGLYTLVEHLFL